MTPPDKRALLYDCSGERWPDDVAKVIETTRCLDDARYVAIMPDVHLASGFCVGTVLATRDLIYPSAIGSDIGCGMLAVAFNVHADAVDQNVANRLLNVLPKLVPWNRQADARQANLNPRSRQSHHSLDRVLMREGQVQLGTLGRGNHFLELQRDVADGRLWLMVHTGSRGLGQAISDYHIEQAHHKSHGKRLLHAQSNAGKAYRHDMHIARGYARLNRMRIASAVAFALEQLINAQADFATMIHTDHNHVRREQVEGRPHWVHRKGAAPAFEGQVSVIPGSMATPSFHVVGKGYGPALQSCAHGAGRKRDRTTARRLTSARNLLQEMGSVWFNTAAATRLTDEAPSAYKDIRKVMRNQRKQVRILRELQPILSYKGV